MRPFSFFTATLLVLASQAQAETGLASWYGWREHGHAMANGKPFDALGDNAASRTYPLGTHLRVTNTANGKHADIVIQDRGPYVTPRILDVSLGTARILGFERQGVTMVSIEPAPPAVIRPAVYRYRVRPTLRRATPHHPKHRRHAKR